LVISRNRLEALEAHREAGRDLVEVHDHLTATELKPGFGARSRAGQPMVPMQVQVPSHRLGL
jgi:hypothetical protein